MMAQGPVVISHVRQDCSSPIEAGHHGYLELRIGITVSRAYDIKRMNTFL